MKVKFRNKDCKECPQNEREDIVWEKGFNDGGEIGFKQGQKDFRKIFWRFYWKRY